ncbi:L-amino acid amidase [Cladorrhinum sp. PSN332]|nr:L-amino acid amidase [Cladorrhinum sp. PSN332]
MAPITTEGKVDFNAPDAGTPSKTWYKIVGSLELGTPPLILLHGGPGAGHEYLSSLIDLHDNYGIPLFWTTDLFLKELDNLIDKLKLREKGFHVLGQSWAVISSGPASIPLDVKGCEGLLAALPPDVRKTLEDCDRQGDHENEEFEKASAVFYARHVCRLDPYPDEVLTAFKHLKEDPTAYLTIQGPSEFIEVETLLINGRYDEVTSLSIEPWFKHIPKVKWVTLENSSHMAHYEDREGYMEIVGKFLSSD